MLFKEQLNSSLSLPSSLLWKVKWYHRQHFKPQIYQRCTSTSQLDHLHMGSLKYWVILSLPKGDTITEGQRYFWIERIAWIHRASLSEHSTMNRICVVINESKGSKRDWVHACLQPEHTAKLGVCHETSYMPGHSFEGLTWKGKPVKSQVRVKIWDTDKEEIKKYQELRLWKLYQGTLEIIKSDGLMIQLSGPCMSCSFRPAHEEY